MGASDALYGVIYTPEELGAEVDAEGKPVPAPTFAKPASRVQQAMNAEPEPAPMEDLGERVERDWIGEAGELSDVDALRALWLDAQAAGAEQGILDSIRLLATPADEPAAV
jgi:hypothetical protein